jgi:hypothetical protein
MEITIITSIKHIQPIFDILGGMAVHLQALLLIINIINFFFIFIILKAKKKKIKTKSKSTIIPFS